MAALALIAGIGALSTMSVYMYSMKFNKNPMMIMATSMFSFAAGRWRNHNMAAFSN